MKKLGKLDRKNSELKSPKITKVYARFEIGDSFSAVLKFGKIRNGRLQKLEKNRETTQKEFC